MINKSLRVADYLEHILSAIDRISRYTADIDFDAFVASDMRQDAVIRNLETIGEACRNITRADPSFRAKHPDLPLKAAMEMRNVRAHAYFGVDLSIVWRTIQTDLHGLEQQVRQALPIHAPTDYHLLQIDIYPQGLGPPFFTPSARVPRARARAPRARPQAARSSGA